MTRWQRFLTWGESHPRNFLLIVGVITLPWLALLGAVGWELLRRALGDA